MWSEKKVLRLTQEMKLTRQSQTSQVIPGRSKGSPLVSRRGATRWPIRARRHVVVLHGNAARAGGDVELFHRRARYASHARFPLENRDVAHTRCTDEWGSIGPHACGSETCTPRVTPSPPPRWSFGRRLGLRVTKALPASTATGIATQSHPLIDFD